MADIKELLDQYNALEKQIFEYFEYKEDWRVIPLEDNTDEYWMLLGGDERGDGGRIVFSPEPFTRESIEVGQKICVNSVYTQRFLPRWVYRKDTYTMICADTQTDGNKFLQVFSNERECKDPELRNLARDCWA